MLDLKSMRLWGDDTCLDCRWYSSQLRTSGECHRKAPTVVVVGHEVKTVWPRVNPFEGFCGEGEVLVQSKTEDDMLVDVGVEAPVATKAEP